MLPPSILRGRIIFINQDEHGIDILYTILDGRQYNKIELQRENVPSDMCAQRRLRPACVSSQSDQSLRWAHETTLHTWLSKVHPVKSLIRLRECAVWSESTLGAYFRRYFFWSWGSIGVCRQNGSTAHLRIYKSLSNMCNSTLSSEDLQFSQLRYTLYIANGIMKALLRLFGCAVCQCLHSLRFCEGPFCVWQFILVLFKQVVVLTLSILGKIFSKRHIGIFFLFSPENRFGISCKFSPMEQFAWNIKSCFLGEIRKNVINLSSAERVVKLLP